MGSICTSSRFRHYSTGRADIAWIVYSVPNIHAEGTTVGGAVKIPDGLYASAGVTTKSASLAPQAEYNGGYANAKDIYIRIANGGAGQSGLIGAWADAFIKYCVEEKKREPFKVGWYLGDTTESLGLLAAGSVDIAVTYNAAAEKQSMDSGKSMIRSYGFRVSYFSPKCGASC